MSPLESTAARADDDVVVLIGFDCAYDGLPLHEYPYTLPRFVRRKSYQQKKETDDPVLLTHRDPR